MPRTVRSRPEPMVRLIPEPGASLLNAWRLACRSGCIARRRGSWRSGEGLAAGALDAPVQEVFAFVANPKKLLLEAFPLKRRVTLSDIVTTPEGSVTGFTWSTRFALLPFAFNASCTRLEHIPNERIVDKYSTGGLSTHVFEPCGDGPRLTSTTGVLPTHPTAGQP